MKGSKPHIKLERDTLPDMAPPDWFSGDAKAEWDRVYPLLVERKILTRADLGILENYCTTIGLAREMGREIAKLGAVQKVYGIDKEGKSLLLSVRKNPAVSIMEKANDQARQMAGELGLTPVSRSRPTVQDDDAGDSLFDWEG
jgi:P27 family predicted phage terminase small subunit